MTKITIFSGFLGAGKTTLIKKLASEVYKGEKLLLIENEFGDISIDGGFMSDVGITVSELSSGCICCSLVGDFTQALNEAIREYAPDRVLIEPSGVGKLSDVIAAVKTIEPLHDIELDGYVAVADAGKCKMYSKNFGEFYKDQIYSASAIILSRTENTPEATLTETVAILRTMNAKAPIVTTPWNELEPEQLAELISGRVQKLDEVNEHEHTCNCHHEHEHDEHEHTCNCHHEHEHNEHEHTCNCHHEHEHNEHEHTCNRHHEHGHEGHHHADEVFTSWGKESPHVYSAEDIRAALAALDSGEYGEVLRAKGIVPCTDGTWLHFDYVPNEINVRTGGASFTGRLCVIGSALHEDKLAVLFGVEGQYE